MLIWLFIIQIIIDIEIEQGAIHVGHQATDML